MNEVPADAPAATPAVEAEPVPDAAPVVEAPTAARKASPFADSPYVAYESPVKPAQPYYTEPRKKRTINWLSAVTILLVLALTVSFAIFLVSANAQNSALKSQITSLQAQIKELQKEI